VLIKFSDETVRKLPLTVDERGVFKASVELPLGCQALSVSFRRGKTRRQGYIRGVTISTSIPAISELQSLSVSRPFRIALYGDLDLNVVDGSAIWLVSAAKVLAMTGLVEVDVYLKRKLARDTVIRPLIDDPAIRILYSEDQDVSYPILDAWLQSEGNSEDRAAGYDLVLIRGLEANGYLAQQLWLQGKLVPYITDLPANDEKEGLLTIINAARVLLCQTEEIVEYYGGVAPEAVQKSFTMPSVLGGLSTTIGPFFRSSHVPV
jgi:hypothetical protein